MSLISTNSHKTPIPDPFNCISNAVPIHIPRVAAYFYVTVIVQKFKQMQLKPVSGEEVEVDQESVNGIECCSEWTRRVLKGCGCAHGLEIS